ncbi:MAG TPA: TIGR03619 family F420-dependent LLM class oxidoreductase [Candidatus Acidoferrum sp.]|nr:TIGR03619 family F420-dependent LLM class oxidoreductase [Candidatus Acidoferrum sp.]
MDCGGQAAGDNNVQAIRDYAQTAEGLGYDYLLVYDRVLGAHPNRQPKLTGPYTYEHPFYEPMVFFGFLAAITTRLELVTGILILPQRQTALVAKQTAELDVLSQGRLRLGIGIGWNYVEYETLGADFRTRGRRVEEQIEVLRKLWTQAHMAAIRSFREVARDRIDAYRRADLRLPIISPRVGGGDAKRAAMDAIRACAELLRRQGWLDASAALRRSLTAWAGSWAP